MASSHGRTCSTVQAPKIVPIASRRVATFALVANRGQAVEMDAPSCVAEVGGPGEVVDHDLQVGHLLGQSATTSSWSLVASTVATRS